MKSIFISKDRLFFQLALAFALILLGSACTSKVSYEGYKVLDSRFVDEVNAECVHLEHIKSGARVFKIKADDPNKLFAVGFKTVPDSDCGTPHIMEHSVLNGSENFPVKSPFDVLMQGSLNTFLNAMTGADMTIYPVASMNDKDYFNLMHVYLDAVFNPLIEDDPRIFKQEGWHYELTAKDKPLIYKGVVYNEMKGSFSSPERQLGYHVYRNLFPDNAYRFSSGGYPVAIPELTYEDFLAFYKKHYHPSNSYILLYGDADLAEELEFINENYLSAYDRSDDVVEIREQEPFDQLKKVVKAYPVLEGSDTENRTFLQLSFVVGKATDYARNMAYDVMSDVLVNQESAPLKKALQEAGIGSDVSAYIDGNKQTAFHIIVRNANEKDMDRFYELTMEVLENAAEDGLDKKALEGTINRMEFRLREGDSPQKGLTYGFQLLGGWFFEGNPFAGIQFEEPLSEVKQSLTGDYMEQLIAGDLLSNKHCLLLALKPEPGLQAEIDNEIRTRLDSIKANMDNETMEQLIRETNELIEYQQRADSPEALETIPVLSLDDISEEVVWYEAEEIDINGIKTLYLDEFTNGIVYNKLLFDLRILPLDKLQYASLLSHLLGKFDTEKYTYGEIDNELNIHTGAFSSSINLYNAGRDDSNIIPKFQIQSKAVSDKTGKMLELAAEIISKTDFSDKDRLKTLMIRHFAEIDANVKNNGLNYAAQRMFSYFSHTGVCNEMMSGLDYYWFIADLVNNFDEKSDEIIANLSDLSASLFTSSNLTAGITCSEKDFERYSDAFTALSSSMPEGESEYLAWDIIPVKKNEAFETTSGVQYVIKGGNFKDLGYDWSGKMLVLNQILSTDWLQNQIRVIGGAYGGFASFSPTGNMYFASYRDPNLQESLEVYDQTASYLEDFDADEKAMTRYIIGTVSNLDYPETSSMKASTALSRYFNGISREFLQKQRNEVLGTTAGDIKAMRTMVDELMDLDIYSVYGNKQKIEQNKELFMSLIDPIR
ncbi:MAG: insulinase family protein [Bacteroidales bacterium]|jgi:Zn-dependent M16 (insulinase) family peptidase|nr:insulinase family protein [Bacteroidales bacterium]